MSITPKIAKIKIIKKPQSKTDYTLRFNLKTKFYYWSSATWKVIGCLFTELTDVPF